MNEDIKEFLTELASHIAGIDNHCDHCINGFLEFGEFDYEEEEHCGGVNKLVAKYFPGYKFKHTRSKSIKERSTVEFIFR